MKPQQTIDRVLAAEAIFSLAAAKRWLIHWLTNQVTLVEPFCLALAFHVLLFPVLWVSGWALPWPKSPVITTVVEFDLQKWPMEAKPKKIIDIRYPNLNP